MKRTQFYIDEKTFRKLKKVSAARKTTVSALVREAIEQTYFGNVRPTNWRQVLEEAVGSWKDSGDISCSTTYVRGLPKATRRRFKR